MDRFLDDQFDTFIIASTTYLSDKKILNDIERNKERAFKNGSDDELQALVELYVYNQDQDIVFPNSETHWFIAGDMEDLAMQTQRGADWCWFCFAITSRQKDFLFCNSWILMQSRSQPDLIGHAKTAKAWTKWEKSLYYSMSYTDGERYMSKKPTEYLKEMQFGQYPVLAKMARPT